jgi:predicted CXXCH cytochrome family protein
VNRRLLLVAAILGAAAIGGAVAWRAWRPSPTPDGAGEPASGASNSTAAADASATYVGTEACAGCHRDAYDAWHTSQHREAMLPASVDTVKGRFDGRQLRHDDIVSTFFQRDGRYWVRTDGPDGALADFEVRDTFGVSPLQQYLIELPNGRLQALSIAWDTRPKDAGGQRWFSLYPGPRLAHTDPLHWTQRMQNWNFMCADCHSTDVRKNYDAASDSFHTTWRDIDVACEACHGPGSRHVAWAQAATRAGSDHGLTVDLTERHGVTWAIDPATKNVVRSTPRTTTREIEMCARCHSRRSQIADGYRPGAPLLDFYEPATLTSPLYYADGQQQDEVYIYGSFLQSRMAHAGVTCSDCHEPHAGTLRADGNALCTRCHAAARYDAPAHHHHAATSAGASCVACHMPARTYMQIDARRDHSLRVPRPDLTIATGAPNACTQCHANRSASWAASAVRQWLGRDAVGFQDFAIAFHDADERRPGAATSLLAIATSADEPAIVRASALDRLADAGAPASTLASGLRDVDPLVRLGALHALAQAPPADQAALAARLLSDPIRTVRIAAARLLAPSTSRLTDRDRAVFDRVSADVVAAGRFNADRPESRVSLGVFFADQGRATDAEAEYRAAIRLAPDFPPGYVNLAELLRATRSESDAEQILRAGLTHAPASADLHFALGLSLVRAHRTTDATTELQRASDLAPQVSRYTYTYAVALHDTGQPAAAMRVLRAALARHPGDRDVLVALVTFEQEAGDLAAAREHAAQLVRQYPDDADARALQQSLGR